MRNGVIAQKLQALDQVLGELRSLGTVTAAQLESDWRTRRAVERNLQVLIEVVIDVCQRLIALAGQTPATTGVGTRCAAVCNWGHCKTGTGIARCSSSKTSSCIATRT
jgi:hypothetical protein